MPRSRKPPTNKPQFGPQLRANLERRHPTATPPPFTGWVHGDLRPEPVPPTSVDILDLISGLCRWPVHDQPDGGTYCGARCEGTYCHRHMRRAYAPRH